MKLPIALTLAFFAVVSGLGVIRDLSRAMRDSRPARYLGVATAVIVSVWCFYAAWWLIQQ